MLAAEVHEGLNTFRKNWCMPNDPGESLHPFRRQSYLRPHRLSVRRNETLKEILTLLYEKPYPLNGGHGLCALQSLLQMTDEHRYESQKLCRAQKNGLTRSFRDESCFCLEPMIVEYTCEDEEVI